MPPGPAAHAAHELSVCQRIRHSLRKEKVMHWNEVDPNIQQEILAHCPHCQRCRDQVTAMQSLLQERTQ